MNLKDEMQYQMYKTIERYVKPGIATKLSKVLAEDIFDNLNDKWRTMARLNIESLTVEALGELGYKKIDDDEDEVLA